MAGKQTWERDRENDLLSSLKSHRNGDRFGRSVLQIENKNKTITNAVVRLNNRDRCIRSSHFRSHDCSKKKNRWNHPEIMIVRCSVFEQEKIFDIAADVGTHTHTVDKSLSIEQLFNWRVISHGTTWEPLLTYWRQAVFSERWCTGIGKRKRSEL